MCDYSSYELPTLCIDNSFVVTNLTKFWGIIVSKFYDPREGVDMLTIFLISNGSCLIVHKLWLDT